MSIPMPLLPARKPGIATVNISPVFALGVPFNPPIVTNPSLK